MGVEEDGVQLAVFAYDALGRRTQTVEGSVTRFLVYDGADAVLVGEDALRAPIVHGSGVDEPLLYNAPGSTLVTPLSDGLGSITEELDANGAVLRARRYLAYGNIVETMGVGPTSYAFTARVFDDAAGLQYSRARHYDPKVGRFLQQDPIGFAGGDANLYAYTFANPVNYTDPSGEIVPFLVANAAVNLAATFLVATYNGEDLSLEQVGVALASGAFGGFVGARAFQGALTSSALQSFLSAAGLRGRAAASSSRALQSFLGAASGGAAGQGLSNVLSPCDSQGSVSLSALFGGVFGAAGNTIANRALTGSAPVFGIQANNARAVLSSFIGSTGSGFANDVVDN